MLVGKPDLSRLNSVKVDPVARTASVAPSSARLWRCGAVERVPREDTAFGHRDAKRLLWVVSAYGESDDAEQIDWCRRIFDAMTPTVWAASHLNQDILPARGGRTPGDPLADAQSSRSARSRAA